MSRIAIIAGGWSCEREVSLSSGRCMAEAARKIGHEVIEIDIERKRLCQQLEQADPELVINALHGPYGEDGCVQGLLELLGLPYSHSGVLASALAMHKEQARRVFAGAGLDIARGGEFDRQQVMSQHVLPPPYIIKPVADGSSFGVRLIGKNEPPPKPDKSWSDTVLVEEYIPGQELTVGVLSDRAMIVTEINFLRKYYDYSAKYDLGESVHKIPADIPDQISSAAMEAALTAHRALGCSGVTRSDFRYDPDANRLVILETNTQPGMTPVSLVPEQAQYIGMSYEDLVEWIISQTFFPK